MMGHKEPLKGGLEYDAISPWRKVVHMKPGMRKWAKNKAMRRLRQTGRAICQKWR